MTDKLEIGRYDLGSAESSPAFFTNGVIYADLNVAVIDEHMQDQYFRGDRADVFKDTQKTYRKL